MLSFCASQWAALARASTVRAAVRSATQLLERAGVPEPAPSAEHLAVAAFRGVRTRRCARTSPTSPTPDELSDFASMCAARADRRTPVQYLVGEWDFHNITLRVRAPTLIPRPETEELVEHVLGDAALPPDARVLDIGTGSGALLLALLHARAGWRGVGVDVARHALELSTENALMVGVEARARFVEASAKGLTLSKLGNAEDFDVVVSNPPYIPADDMGQLEPEVAAHEDRKALCGGVTGLDVVDDVLEAVPGLLKKGGFVWLEVDESHPAVLAERAYPGLAFVKKMDDLYGRPRFCQFVKL